MKNRELFASESAVTHQSNGNGIAHRHGDCGAAGGGDGDLVGFCGDARVKRNVAAGCQRTIAGRQSKR